ncbi:MAG: class II glutamine amidotransferase [Candidatus Planktophila sp.]
MCRLLGFVATQERSFAEVVGEGFSDFVELSKEHKDGWGISTCSRDSGDTETFRDLTLAAESATFTETTNVVKSDGALLHLRLASKGLSVDLANNHPFNFGDYSFMHNGTIKSIAAVQEFVAAKYLDRFTSTTDSERYFYTVLTCIDELGLVEGVRKAVKTISTNCDFTSINSMLLTPEKMIAVCEFNDSDSSEWTVDSHYELRYTAEEGVIKVASTGWGKDHWARLGNHSILVIDRTDLTFEVLPL